MVKRSESPVTAALFLARARVLVVLSPIGRIGFDIAPDGVEFAPVAGDAVYACRRQARSYVARSASPARMEFSISV